jgi:hypothetical protein
MMMSVLWYYRAEHTETERLPQYIDSEIFASKHRDIIPAVCIDDKCYVLTFNEFCRLVIIESFQAIFLSNQMCFASAKMEILLKFKIQIKRAIFGRQNNPVSYLLHFDNKKYKSFNALYEENLLSFTSIVI